MFTGTPGVLVDLAETNTGATNGGFRTSCGTDKTCLQNRCNTVFSGKADLLAGCNWFIDWFAASDNPTFVFKQIACPSAITQRSGMGDPG